MSLNPEPPNSCPNIDAIINSVNSAASDAEYELNQLRSHNEELREWGRQWKERAEELQQELSDVLHGGTEIYM